MSDRGLLVLKAAAFALSAGLLLAANLVTPCLRVVNNPARGVSLRYPPGWVAGQWSVHGVQVYRPTAKAARGADATRRGRLWGVHVSLERLSWAEFEEYRVHAGREAAAEWRRSDAGVLAEVAAIFGMQQPAEGAAVEASTLSGRRALMIAGQLSPDPGSSALIVSPGEDIAWMRLYAPGDEDLRRVQREWRAILRTARIYGHGPIARP